MNRILKYAWYQLVVVLAATIFGAAAFAVIAIYWRGKVVSAIIPLGLFVFIYLYRVFFPLKPGQVPFDERDLTIMRQATHISFVVLMYVYAVCCLAPVLVIGNGRIHVMYLGGLVLLTSVLFRITWAIAAIVQYGRGDRDE